MAGVGVVGGWKQGVRAVLGEDGEKCGKDEGLLEEREKGRGGELVRIGEESKVGLSEGKGPSYVENREVRGSRVS